MHFFDEPPPSDVPTTMLLVAFAVFFGFRLAAYTLAGKALNRAFQDAKASAFSVALVRVIFGLIGGYAYARVLPYLPIPGSNALVHLLVIFSGMFVLRIVEWSAVIALFFDQATRDSKRGWFCAVMGAIYSHFLDVPSWLIMTLIVNYFFWFGAI